MLETRYLVAKTSWHATQIMKRIYQGRLRDYDKVLFQRNHDACKRIQKLPLGQQELYSSFRVEFDRSKIHEIDT